MGLSIIINQDVLAGIIKSNISCHASKPLTQELIDIITMQIIESIDFFIKKTR
jgi:hypothetical protein